MLGMSQAVYKFLAELNKPFSFRDMLTSIGEVDSRTLREGWNKALHWGKFSTQSQCCNVEATGEIEQVNFFVGIDHSGNLLVCQAGDGCKAESMAVCQ